MSHDYSLPLRTAGLRTALAIHAWRWAALGAVAVFGSLFYGASLGIVLPQWRITSAALWLALSAGLAWGVLIPALIRFGRVAPEVCLDACLVTMAVGEIVLAGGALVNVALWWRQLLAHAAEINGLIVGFSNLVMAVTLARQLVPQGLSRTRVWVFWMCGLNGSGALFFFLFFQLLHGL